MTATAPEMGTTGTRWRGLDGRATALVLAALPLVPLLAVLAAAWPEGSAWAHVRENLLLDYIAGSAVLVFGGAGLATFIGVATAWLVTMTRFPGRGLFEWALVLPLAFPAYVAGYAWAEMLSVGGVARDAAGPLAPLLPAARSTTTAILVYASVLYPYIYLAARAAFAAQSVCALEASRALGSGPWASFWRVGLPLARPAIVAGAALAGLEIAADYGLADHFGLQTLGIGVFRAWFSTGDLATAARLAALLMLAALTFLAVEQIARRGQRISGVSTRWRALSRTQLGPIAGTAATLTCAAVLLIGFAIPAGRLVALAIETGPPVRALSAPIAATALLATAGSIGALLIAIAASWARRLGPVGTLIAQIPVIGYATPGAVVALGILAVVAAIGSPLASSLAGAGALLALAAAYGARFAAAGQGPLEAGLATITPSISRAAASLGAGPLARLIRVDLPVAAPAGIAAALIVFVEAVKELPATTILRPLNFDTLAVRAHAYASDERLGLAAWPALLIVLVSLGPVLVLSWRLTRARAGATATA